MNEVVKVWNETFEAKKISLIDKAISAIDTFSPELFGPYKFQELDLNEPERLFMLLMSFESMIGWPKSDVKKAIIQKISQLRSEKLLNLDFAKSCVSVSIMEALKIENFVLSGIGEQLYSIFLKNYFAETFGEPSSGKSTKQRTKRKHKKPHFEKIEEEEECDLKPLLDSMDEGQIKPENSSKLFQDDRNTKVADNLQPFEDKNSETNPTTTSKDQLDIAKKNSVQSSKTNRILQRKEEFGLQQKPSQSQRSDKSSLLSKMKQDKLNRQFKEKESTNAPPIRPTLLSEEISNNNNTGSRKKLSESYIIKFQTQNFVPKPQKKDVSERSSPIMPPQNLPENEIEVLELNEEFSSFTMAKNKAFDDMRRSQNNSNANIDITTNQKERIYFNATPKEDVKRRRRPSSHSILKSLSKDLEKDSEGNLIIIEHRASNDNQHSTEQNDGFNRAKTEKSVHRKQGNKRGFKEDQFDMDDNSSQSLENALATEGLAFVHQRSTNLNHFDGETNDLDEGNQILLNLPTNAEGLNKKAKGPKLKKIIKEKFPKDNFKTPGSQTNQAPSGKLGKWSDVQERFTNKFGHATEKAINHISVDFPKVQSSKKDSQSINPPTRLAKRGANLKEQERTLKNLDTANPNVIKQRLIKPKEVQTLAPIKKIMTWNKEGDLREDKALARNRMENPSASTEKVIVAQDITNSQIYGNQSTEAQNQAISAQKIKEDPKTPQKTNLVKKRLITVKLNRWDQMSDQNTENASIDYSQSSDINQISSNQYMSNESKSAKEVYAYSRGYHLQQHNIINYCPVKNSQAIHKFPKGVYSQRNELHDYRFSGLPRLPLDKRVDIQFFQLLDSNIKTVVNELEGFSAKFSQPRQIIKERINRIVRATCPTSNLFISEYGSFASSLLTPYSDLDLAIRGFRFDFREQCVEILNLLSENLQICSFIKNVQPILTAAIPVLKIEADSSIGYENTPSSPSSVLVKVDIIVEMHEVMNPNFPTAMRTTEFIKSCNVYYKTFYHNVLALKFALNCNGLSNVYKGLLKRRAQSLWLGIVVCRFY